LTTSVHRKDPGLLVDGDLQLVIPDESLLDELMAALEHPLTQQEMPQLAGVAREQWMEYMSNAANGFDSGNEAGGIVPAYYFWMRRATGTQAALGDLNIVGSVGLRIGDNENVQRTIGHIGYNVYPFARGRHYAERAARLLFPLARGHGLNPLWITCNPDNLASRRTCERLGATLVDVVPVPIDHPLHARGERFKCRYRIDI
jgi:predicted acetyltransferase